MAAVVGAWTTLGRWRALTRYSPLKWAYRAPTLFLAGVARGGSDTAVFGPDEHLDAGTLANELVWGNVSVFYLCTHGESDGGQYRAVLKASDWYPTQAVPRCRALICDTCDLVDTAELGWRDDLERSGIGREVRLLLGFASKATVSPSTSERGRYFADYVCRGDPVAEAWFAAVHNAAPDVAAARDRPVAIAFGDTAADAAAALAYTWQDLLAAAACAHGGVTDVLRG